jgi:transcriptional regulator with XRE-family HTH domain
MNAPLAWEKAFMRALGDELRTARKQRKWLRRDLLAHLETDLSLQTLATYELGTRHITVVRLVEITLALGASPMDVLARAYQRELAAEEARPGMWLVDLVAASRVRGEELVPLRRWATHRLYQNGPNPVPLDPAAVSALTMLCGIPTERLYQRLKGCLM